MLGTLNNAEVKFDHRDARESDQLFQQDIDLLNSLPNRTPEQDLLLEQVIGYFKK